MYLSFIRCGVPSMSLVTDSTSLQLINVKQLVCTHTLYFLRSKHVLHFLDSMYKLTEQRLVTMPVSLQTQTGLHNLNIKVQNTELTS